MEARSLQKRKELNQLLKAKYAEQADGQMVMVQAGIVFFVSITAVGIVGILRGGGDTRFALGIDLCSLWLVALPAGLLSAFVFKLPVLLVYASIKLDEPVKMIVIFWRLRNRNWMKNVTRNREPEPPMVLEEGMI